MSFSPAEHREILYFIGFVALAMFGAGVAFARALDLSPNPPVRIRFFAELARKLIIGMFVGVLMYAFTKTYGPQPPLVWVVAGLSGAFATEALDLLWVFIRDRVFAGLGVAFRMPPRKK